MMNVRFGEALQVRYTKDNAHDEPLGSRAQKFAQRQAASALVDHGITGRFVYDPDSTNDYFIFNGPRQDTLSRFEALENKVLPDLADKLVKGERLSVEDSLANGEKLAVEIRKDGLFDIDDGVMPLQYSESDLTGGTYLENPQEVLDSVIPAKGE